MSKTTRPQQTAGDPTRSREGTFALVALCLGAGILRLRPQTSLDVYWHIEQGRAVLEHMARQYPDPSGIPEGRLYTNPEWLFDIFIYGLERVGGMSAITLAVAGLAALSCFLVYRIARNITKRPFAAIAISALSVGGASWRFDPRPQSLFLVLLPAAMLLALKGSQAASKKRRVLGIGLVALVALWTQCHSSMIIAPAVILPLALYERDARRDKVWIAMLLCVCALPLIGPFGFGIIDQVLGHAGTDAARHISDMRPMPLTGWWPEPGNSILFIELLAIVGLVGAIQSRKLAPWFFVLVVLGISMTLVSHRFRAAWAILMVPWVGAVWWQTETAFMQKRLKMAALVAMALVGVGLAYGKGLPTLATENPNVPTAGVEVIKKLGLKGRLFNQYDAGGYLGWKLSGDVRVFIDGRTPVFFDSERYFAARSAVEKIESFERLDAGYRFDGALIPRNRGLSNSLWKHPDWHAVWLGEKDVLFLPDRQLERLGAAQSLKFLNPAATLNLVEECRRIYTPEVMVREIQYVASLSATDPWPYHKGALLCLDCFGDAPKRKAANAFLEEARKLAPRHPTTLFLFAKLQASTGNKDAALILLQSPELENHVDAALLALHILSNAKNHRRVIQRGMQLVEEMDDQTPAIVRCQIAKAAFELGDHELSATQAFRAVVMGDATCLALAKEHAASGRMDKEKAALIDALSR